MYTYRGGADFINIYLERFSKREDDNEFLLRKKITYNPAFAKEAVNEIRNSIYQRLGDVSRKGGSKSYQQAVIGKDYGVDLLGSSMNSFLGRKVLTELLVMSRVGIFVDMPPLSGITVADNINKVPYLYTYKAEDIRTWRFDDYDAQSEFSSLLLRDYIFQYDDETGLPIGETVRFRHFWVEDKHVYCQFYDEGGSPSFYLDDEESEPIKLDIDRIPFVVVELSDGILTEAANYQIALMNIASSDLSYILKSNFPFYTEQYEPRASSANLRSAGSDTPGTALDAAGSKTGEVVVGSSSGRRYPKGLERPQFINPSSEPLKASMAKQEQLKTEIRELVHLAVSNLQPTRPGMQTTGDYGIESGLAYIGLELEHAERRVAQFWSMYEKGTKAATINYPEKYTILSEEERRKEADELSDLLERIPSRTLQKEISKRIADVIVGNKVPSDTMDKIRKEIEEAPAVTSSPETIAKNVEAGICDLKLAAKLCGYPEGTVEAAAEDHTERLARIATHQENAATHHLPTEGDPAARGVKDKSGDPSGAGSKEKTVSKDTTKDPKVKSKIRGKAKDGKVNDNATGIESVPYQGM